MLNFIGQVFTALSYIVFWVSRYKKEKKNMLLYDNISRVLTIVSFIFLNTYDGVKNTIYVIFRNIIGDKVKNESKKKKLVVFFVMLAVLFLVFGIGFNGIATIFITICAVFNLYGVIMCNEQGMRIFGMIGSMFYTLFMFASKNIMGGICEIVTFCIILGSYIKYKDKKVV